jgi:hypothetical protein
MAGQVSVYNLLSTAQSVSHDSVVWLGKWVENSRLAFWTGKLNPRDV